MSKTGDSEQRHVDAGFRDKEDANARCGNHVIVRKAKSEPELMQYVEKRVIRTSMSSCKGVASSKCSTKMLDEGTLTIAAESGSRTAGGCKRVGDGPKVGVGAGRGGGWLLNGSSSLMTCMLAAVSCAEWEGCSCGEWSR